MLNGVEHEKNFIISGPGVEISKDGGNDVDSIFVMLCTACLLNGMISAHVHVRTVAGQRPAHCL